MEGLLLPHGLREEEMRDVPPPDDAVLVLDGPEVKEGHDIPSQLLEAFPPKGFLEGLAPVNASPGGLEVAFLPEGVVPPDLVEEQLPLLVEDEPPGDDAGMFLPPFLSERIKVVLHPEAVLPLEGHEPVLPSKGKKASLPEGPVSPGEEDVPPREEAGLGKEGRPLLPEEELLPVPEEEEVEEEGEGFLQKGRFPS